MPLNGCRCRLCRQHQDMSDVEKALEEASKPLAPEQQRILDRIVRDAFERLSKQHEPEPPK